MTQRTIYHVTLTCGHSVGPLSLPPIINDYYYKPCPTCGQHVCQVCGNGTRFPRITHVDPVVLTTYKVLVHRSFEDEVTVEAETADAAKAEMWHTTAFVGDTGWPRQRWNNTDRIINVEEA